MHLCYAFLFSNTLRLCISSLFYTEPRQYCSSPFIALTFRFHCKTFLHFSIPMLYDSIPCFANAAHFFTLLFLCFAMQNPSLLFLRESFLCSAYATHITAFAGLFRRIAFLSYAPPWLVKSLPLYTTAYSVISVHLKRPLPEFRH